MYHYVRNAWETKFPGIHGENEAQFIEQVKFLKNRFHMLNAEELLMFLDGELKLDRDACVLTFDDGLKEHANFVTDVLHEHKIQGQFFIPTAGLSERYVLPVHKNHFLLAYLPIEEYTQRVNKILMERFPNQQTYVSNLAVKETYRWDNLPISKLKYLLNYQLPNPIRNEVLDIVFMHTFGDEDMFSKELYTSWEDLKNMVDGGMLIGGHSHRHNVLSSLSAENQEKDIVENLKLLRKHLVQKHWFFSYPFGKKYTYNKQTIKLLSENGIEAAYCTELSSSEYGIDPFQINRIDPKDIGKI